MAVVTQLYFQIVEEINYMFRLFSGWAIIRLKLEYGRKVTHYNVDYTSRMGKRDLVLQQLWSCVAILYIRDVEQLWSCVAILYIRDVEQLWSCVAILYIRDVEQLWSCVAILYIRDVEPALVTALYVVSSAGSSTCGLELSSEVALSVEIGGIATHYIT
jgi:hypothetical protein